jgi:hypothetical protein
LNPITTPHRNIQFIYIHLTVHMSLFLNRRFLGKKGIQYFD